MANLNSVEMAGDIHREMRDLLTTKTLKIEIGNLIENMDSKIVDLQAEKINEDSLQAEKIKTDLEKTRKKDKSLKDRKDNKEEHLRFKKIRKVANFRNLLENLYLK